MTRGLLVDYGGVLTTGVGRSFRAFERSYGMPRGSLLDLLQAAYRGDAEDSAIARFERGEMELDAFEEELGRQLLDAGYDVTSAGLVERLFGGTESDERMWQLVARARAEGVRTGLLSNSWGPAGYLRERFDDHFDAVVISGEVGLRKPGQAIFRLAAERLRLEPDDCAFVDDLERNVEIARGLGMYGVVHRDAATTAAELSPFLEVPLDVGH